MKPSQEQKSDLLHVPILTTITTVTSSIGEPFATFTTFALMSSAITLVTTMKYSTILTSLYIG